MSIPSSAAKPLRLFRSSAIVRVRSINMYMSTEKEAAGATVMLNSPGTPGVCEGREICKSGEKLEGVYVAI